MVEIINQRVPRYAGGRRELITTSETRNHGYDVIVVEIFTVTPITLANLSR